MTSLRVSLGSKATDVVKGKCGAKPRALFENYCRTAWIPG